MTPTKVNMPGDTISSSDAAANNTSPPPPPAPAPAPSSDTTPMQRFIVRPPAFNADRPALWFAQLEGQFHLAGITDETTKFFFASSHLDAFAAAEVQDIILHPPAVIPYMRLKGALIERLTSSQESRLHQLLDKEILGDRKPSQFLRHLKGLVDNVPISILRTKWLSRLPTGVQSILATQQETSLDKLATLADHIMEIPSSNQQVAAVDTSIARQQDVSPLEPRLSRLEGVISELVSSIKNSTQQHPRAFSQPRNRSRSSSRSRSRPPSPNGLCWYHATWGELATNCRSPCNFSGNGAGSR